MSFQKDICNAHVLKLLQMALYTDLSLFHRVQAPYPNPAHAAYLINGEAINASILITIMVSPSHEVRSLIRS